MESLTDKYLIDLKNDLSNWEKWFDDIRIAESHKCDENEDIFYTAILKISCIETNSPYYWILAKVWLADDKCVYDGEADEVGELMSSTLFIINYCPFCGQKLVSN